MSFLSSGKVLAFGVGVGSAAVGFYLYRKNENKIHDFLRSQGINVPESTGGKAPSDLSLEELVMAKEQYEDLIAEKELLAKEAKPKKKTTVKA